MSVFFGKRVENIGVECVEIVDDRVKGALPTVQEDPISAGPLYIPVLKYTNQCYNATSLFRNDRALTRDPMTNEPFSPAEREEIRTANGKFHARQDIEILKLLTGYDPIIFETVESEHLKLGDNLFIVDSVTSYDVSPCENPNYGNTGTGWFISCWFDLEKLVQFGRFSNHEDWKLPDTFDELVEETVMGIDDWYSLFKKCLGESATSVYGMGDSAEGFTQWTEVYTELKSNEYVKIAFNWSTNENDKFMVWTPFGDTTFGELRSCAMRMQGQYEDIKFEWVSDNKVVTILHGENQDSIEAVSTFMGMRAVISDDGSGSFMWN